MLSPPLLLDGTMSGVVLCFIYTIFLFQNVATDYERTQNICKCMGPASSYLGLATSYLGPNTSYLGPAASYLGSTILF